MKWSGRIGPSSAAIYSTDLKKLGLAVTPARMKWRQKAGRFQKAESHSAKFSGLDTGMTNVCHCNTGFHRRHPWKILPPPQTECRSTTSGWELDGIYEEFQCQTLSGKEGASFSAYHELTILAMPSQARTSAVTHLVLVATLDLEVSGPAAGMARKCGFRRGEPRRKCLHRPTGLRGCGPGPSPWSL